MDRHFSRTNMMTSWIGLGVVERDVDKGTWVDAKATLKMVAWLVSLGVGAGVALGLEYA